MVDTINQEVDGESSDKQLELMDHLAELRTRIIRCTAYVALGTAVGWIFYGSFFKLLSAPVMQFLKQSESSFLLTGVAEGFTIKVQISLLVGIIVTLPLITMEGWAFIAPGLTRSERRAVKLVMPLSILLFILGVALGYFVMPTGVKWLISQNPPGAKFMPSVAQTLLFILKMYLAFGLVFQMPVVLMFLAKAGLVSSNTLRSYWRQAIVVLFIIAAAVTPSGDAFTMMMMCTPMVILYLLSIGLVRIVERSS